MIVTVFFVPIINQFSRLGTLGSRSHFVSPCLLSPTPLGVGCQARTGALKPMNSRFGYYWTHSFYLFGAGCQARTGALKPMKTYNPPCRTNDCTKKPDFYYTSGCLAHFCDTLVFSCSNGNKYFCANLSVKNRFLVDDFLCTSFLRKNSTKAVYIFPLLTERPHSFKGGPLPRFFSEYKPKKFSSFSRTRKPTKMIGASFRIPTRSKSKPNKPKVQNVLYIILKPASGIQNIFATATANIGKKSTAKFLIMLRNYKLRLKFQARLIPEKILKNVSFSENICTQTIGFIAVLQMDTFNDAGYYLRTKGKTYSIIFMGIVEFVNFWGIPPIFYGQNGFG